MRLRLLATAGLLSSLSVLLGCPAEVTQTAPAPADPPAPAIDESDPRVVKQEGDLYSVDAAVNPIAEEAAEAGPAKGSGKPDESNGFCRLYSPKLPEPHCCNFEYGFDAKATGEACGKPMYMGESFQRSCGYYFLDAHAGETIWFRVAFVDEATPLEAAKTYARQLNARMQAGVKPTPVPGFKGAYYLSHGGLSWAWVPKGKWDRVRRLAWRDTSCSMDGIAKVVEQLASATPPGDNEQRTSLVPVAR